MRFEMGRPRKDDDLELERKLKLRKKHLEQKYKEDLALAERCFIKDCDIKCFLWFKGYECALDTLNEILDEKL